MTAHKWFCLRSLCVTKRHYPIIYTNYFHFLASYFKKFVYFCSVEYQDAQMATNCQIYGYGDTTQKGAVGVRLIRLWLIALLLSCLPVTIFGAQACMKVCVESIKKECVTRRDGPQRHTMQERQMPLAGAVITAKTGQRVGSSRPVRLLPTNGGKPGRMLGRWTADESYQHSKFFALLLHRMNCGLRIGAASPRYYYVIALRRILC